MSTPAATTASRIDAVHVRESGAGVRSLLQRGLSWVAFHPVPNVVSAIDFSMRRFPEFGLLAGTVQGVRHSYPVASARGDDFFSFHMNRTGLSIVAGRGREMPLRDGEAMLFDQSVPRSISRPGLVDHRIIRLPRSALSPLVPNIDELLMRRLPSSTATLSLLSNYVGALMGDPALASPDVRRLVSSHLADLVALSLGASRDASALAEGRGLRAARLRAIKDDIAKHLTDSDLSPSTVARRHGISESYIRKLLDSEGTSFSDLVLGQRLEYSRRLLMLRGPTVTTIASIAFDSGFGDLSYYNRTFKRRYGLTPSEMREGPEYSAVGTQRVNSPRKRPRLTSPPRSRT